MDKKLLSILVCPVTHRDLSLARPDLLAKLNSAIGEQRVVNRDGTVLGETLEEALVTDDGKVLYPVVNGIPVLLDSESINMEQLGDG